MSQQPNTEASGLAVWLTGPASEAKSAVVSILARAFRGQSVSVFTLDEDQAAAVLWPDPEPDEQLRRFSVYCGLHQHPDSVLIASARATPPEGGHFSHFCPPTDDPAVTALRALEALDGSGLLPAPGDKGGNGDGPGKADLAGLKQLGYL